jgi:O-antigen/teichoic acid export membrane protein
MIRKLKESLKKGSFLHSVLTITSGTVIAQAITVLISPFLTRLYTPEDMGVLASFTAITSVLGVLAAGRYDQAVVLPTTHKEGYAVAFAGISISVLFGLLLSIICLLFRDNVTSVLKLESINSGWFYTIGLFVALIGIDAVLNRVSLRNRHYKVLATTQVTQQIGTAGIKIIYGLLKSGSGGLFFATLFGHIIRLVRLSFVEAKSFFLPENRPSVSDIIYAINRYKKFPLISSWSVLVNSASVQVPVILFVSLFSPTVAGYYSLSHRILNLPISLIGASVSNVFFERAAKSKDDKDELGRITLQIYKKLLLIGAISMSFVTFYGDLLFPFVFGSEWVDAGKYAQWIAIWIVFQLSISPLSNIFTVLERQWESFFWNMFLFLSRLSFIPIFFFVENTLIIMAAYAMISALFYFIYSIRVLSLTEIKISQIMLSLITNVGVIYLVQFFISFFIRKILLQL